MLKSVSLPPFGFTPLNHLAHNRKIKMSKRLNYFGGINNNLTFMAKLLQHSKASWSGKNLQPEVSQVLKQPGDGKQQK